MNIPTQNGMGIKPKGIAWKPNYGMGIKTGNGMGLKASYGMGIAQDDNYFKFNEYERKRKYLQMGSHKPSEPRSNPKRKEPPKKEQKETKPAKVEEPLKAAPVKEVEPTKDFDSRKKWDAAVTGISAVNAFKTGKSKPGPEQKYVETLPYDGNSVGSMSRTMSLFEQLMYV